MKFCYILNTYLSFVLIFKKPLKLAGRPRSCPVSKARTEATSFLPNEISRDCGRNDLEVAMTLSGAGAGTTRPPAKVATMCTTAARTTTGRTAGTMRSGSRARAETTHSSAATVAPACRSAVAGRQAAFRPDCSDGPLGPCGARQALRRWNSAGQHFKSPKTGPWHRSRPGLPRNALSRTSADSRRPADAAGRCLPRCRRSGPGVRRRCCR